LAVVVGAALALVVVVVVVVSDSLVLGSVLVSEPQPYNTSSKAAANAAAPVIAVRLISQLLSSCTACSRSWQTSPVHWS